MVNRNFDINNIQHIQEEKVVVPFVSTLNFWSYPNKGCLKGITTFDNVYSPNICIVQRQKLGRIKFQVTSGNIGYTQIFDQIRIISNAVKYFVIKVSLS